MCPNLLSVFHSQCTKRVFFFIPIKSKLLHFGTHDEKNPPSLCEKFSVRLSKKSTITYIMINPHYSYDHIW